MKEAATDKLLHS